MLNADMSKQVIVRASQNEWQTSPSSTVRRKRFHLVGEPESGQVTSLVEYLPGATFHRHEHPDGEEILVLEGVFSDEAGDWPAGSWLLNPEGFAHAPFSEKGCLLFVKLRQYPGAAHLKLDWPTLPNQSKPTATKPVTVSELLIQGDESISIVSFGYDEVASDEEQVTREYTRQYESGVEGFVLEGEVEMNGNPLVQHDWFRLPAGASLTLASNQCRLYLKANNVIRLRSVTE